MKKSVVRKDLPLIITGLVACGLVGVAAYVHINHKSPKAANTTPASNSVLTPKSANGVASHPGAGAAGTSNTDSSTAAATTTHATPPPAPTDPQYNSTTLAKPTQTFNKSHTPISLNETDQSKPDYPSLDSTCQSLAGATCEIHAVNGTTDVLVAGPVTITDTTGVDLPWNAKTKGLSAGVWQIIAIAKANGQTASSEPVNLTVNP